MLCIGQGRAAPSPGLPGSQPSPRPCPGRGGKASAGTSWCPQPSRSLAILTLGSHSQTCLEKITRQKKELGKSRLSSPGEGTKPKCHLDVLPPPRLRRAAGPPRLLHQRFHPGAFCPRYEPNSGLRNPEPWFPPLCLSLPVIFPISLPSPARTPGFARPPAPAQRCLAPTVPGMRRGCSRAGVQSKVLPGRAASRVLAGRRFLPLPSASRGGTLGLQTSKGLL